MKPSFLSLAISAALAWAGTQPMTFLDVLEFRQVGAGTLSRDGRAFAYTISTLDWKQGRRYTDIHLSNASGGPSRQMTFTADKDESAPAISPDGRWLAFLSNRDGNANQLFLMSMAGGEARRISHASGAVETFAFSRDGRWIAFTAGRSKMRQIWLYDVTKDIAAALTKHSTGVAQFAWAADSAHIYFTAGDSVDPNEEKRLEAKFDVRIVNPPVSPRHLWEVAVSDKQERRLSSGADFSVAEFRVSKNGRWISFTGASVDRFQEQLDRRDNEAYLYEVPSGHVERLTNNHVAESLPVVSPDGRWVAVTAPDEFTYFRNNKIYLRETREGAWRKLLAERDGDAHNLAWSADGKTIYFLDGMGLNTELFALDAASGALSKLSNAPGVITASYADDCDQFVLQYESPSQPRDYFLAKPAEVMRRDRWMRLSDANPQVERFALAAYEVVRWRSSDGREVEGILYKPLGYEAGKRYPLIVQVHGGPAGASQANFSATHNTYAHVFAAGGYAILQPNYRGSTNYGEKFKMQIAGDYFRQAFDDIMTGVDDMIRRGVADPGKLGMMGWSAGGHWSNWTLTHTDRFKAISSGAGAVNWISMYAQTDTRASREYYFQGTPYDNWDHYVAVSPLRYIKNAKTPTLIHVGQDDARVPRPQSEELHMALKKLGVPTEFIVYPRMGHAITEPRYQMVKMVAEYNWFEKWIKGKPGWFDWKELLDTLPKEAKSE